ncbi:MAG: OmpA family protein [Burkholderiaceae bacterium]|nr:OmpA family protein [Burkholderiaceae bacterium]
MNRFKSFGVAAAVIVGLVGCQANKPVVFDPTTDESRNIFGKRNVYFDNNSAAIRDDAKKIISAHVSYMQNNSAVMLTLQGSADSIKPNPKDLKLATARATAVRDAMVKAGVEAKRIDVKAIVDTEAAKPGKDPAKGRNAAFIYR